MKKYIFILCLIIPSVFANSIFSFRKDAIKYIHEINPNANVSMRDFQESSYQLETRLKNALFGESDFTKDIFDQWEISQFSNKSDPNNYYALESSSFFNNRLKKGIYFLNTQRKYAAPLVINPSWFADDVKKHVAKKNRNICLKSLDQSDRFKDLKTDPNGNRPGGINQMIRFYYDSIVSDTSQSNKNYADNKNTDHSNAIEVLNKFIVKNYPDVLNRLGRIFNIKMKYGLLYKIYFTTSDNIKMLRHASTVADDKKISLNLAMLLSFKSGDDQGFVDINQCFYNYIKGQRDAFSTKLKEINGVAKDKLFASSKKADAETLYKQYTNDLALYLGEHDEEDENFIKEQFKIVEKILPIAKSKLSGAVNVNRSLAKLTENERNFMTLVFVHLTSKSLASSDEIRLMQMYMNNQAQIINKEISELEKAGGDSINQILELRKRSRSNKAFLGYFQKINDQVLKVIHTINDNAHKKSIEANIKSELNKGNK